ncbi:MAG TPA: class I SAM-dependent methyltransferase [Acidimicrobiales bacterium]
MAGEKIHEVAASGFARGAEEYEAGRPGYPQAAVDLIARELEIGPGSTVVDVGAGTGKFTRLLLPTGARVVGVEPVAEMREVFARAVPGVEIVDGTAEAIPLGDGEVDVVTAAQAFHWVDAVPAVAEVHRVVRPGGGVAFLWNSRDASVDWVRRVKELMDRVVGGTPRYGNAYGGGWERAMADHGGFTPMERVELAHEHPVDRELMRARVASTSYVSMLPDSERAAVLAEIDAIVDEAGLGETFTEPYRTEVFWCTRR